METRELVNHILHTLRNSELLELKSIILMASFSGREVLDIEEAYDNFAYSLESRIEDCINDFKNK